MIEAPNASAGLLASKLDELIKAVNDLAIRQEAPAPALVGLPFQTTARWRVTHIVFSGDADVLYTLLIGTGTKINLRALAGTTASLTLGATTVIPLPITIERGVDVRLVRTGTTTNLSEPNAHLIAYVE